MVRKLVNQVVEKMPTTITEFGAGTGIITKELDHRCFGSTLMVFEKDENLREYVHTQFPHLPIYSEALSLPRAMNELGVEKVDCIVSGLPFALFPRKKIEQFLDMIYSQLASEGMFVMFQYSLQMRKYVMRVFDEVTIQFVPFNFPPRFYLYMQK